MPILGDDPAHKASAEPKRVTRPAGIDLAGVLSSRLVAMAFGLATSIYVARALGPSGKGTLAIVALAATQSAMLVSLGIDTAIVHYGGRRKATAQELAGVSVFCAAALGVFGMVVAAGTLRFLLGEDAVGDVRAAAYLLVATIPASLLILYWQALLRSVGRIVEASMLAVVNAVLLFVAAIIALESGRGLAGLVRANAAVELVLLVVTIALGLAAGFQPRRPRTVPLARRLAGYGLRGHIGTVLQGLNYRLDVFLVALLLDTGDVGMYAIAVAAGEILWLIPNSLGIVLLQRVAASSDTRATKTTALANRVVFFVTVLFATAWLFLAGALIEMMYGSEFAAASTPLRLLLPGICALSVWKNLVNDLSGRGRPQDKSWTAGVGVVGTIVLDLILIPPFGLAGAALASSAAYLMATAAIVVLYRRETGATLHDLFVVSPADAREVTGLVRRAATQRSGRLVGDEPSSELIPPAHFGDDPTAT